MSNRRSTFVTCQPSRPCTTEYRDDKVLELGVDKRLRDRKHRVTCYSIALFAKRADIVASYEREVEFSSSDSDQIHLQVLQCPDSSDM
jgi:hypothetical protein